ncbi:PTS system mannose/fructose/N-acetylgalactosamine-transporter subunit IIB [Anaerococcus provencensis]|uniref:PTS system mannose/fructose/N-acetylgalactosamine-transporter subunit IIB n=1 Tax=Anaerococcus provencensis TaxID=938293 RepID=UPI0002FE33D0|nr:PTS sugar transporter subunit IIB [Anaerococcus provencensis]
MAKAVLLRIDDRLLHGQVARNWMKQVGADVIVVANDLVSEDEKQQHLMDLVTPMGSKSYFFGISEASSKIKDLEEEDALVLVESPADALKLIEDGIEIDSVNVGNIHQTSGKEKVNESIFVDQNDIDTFKKIETSGKKLDFRTLPNDQAIDFDQLFK